MNINPSSTPRGGKKCYQFEKLLQECQEQHKMTRYFGICTSLNRAVANCWNDEKTAQREQFVDKAAVEMKKKN